MSPETAQMDSSPFISILYKNGRGARPPILSSKVCLPLSSSTSRDAMEYVVCSSTRPRRPTVVIRCHRFLLSWSPLRDVICKFHALTHGASSLTFVVFITVVVIVAITQCDVNASGARSEDIVIDVCCCQ